MAAIDPPEKSKAQMETEANEAFKNLEAATEHLRSVVIANGNDPSDYPQIIEFERLKRERETEGSRDFEAKLAKRLPRGGDDANEKLPAARWTRPREVAAGNWHEEPGAFFLGYRDGRAIWRKDNRHILLVAGSRGGKSVSVIIPNLLYWGGSVLALDPKGELAEKTAGFRAAQPGAKVHVLHPFKSASAAGPPSACFNPLAEIDPDDPNAADEAGLIADALIVQEGTGEKHWTESARELVKAVILHTLTRPLADRHLVTVRDCLKLLHPDTKPAEPPAPKGPGRPPKAEKVLLDTGLYDMLADCGKDKPASELRNFELVVIGTGRSFLAKPDRERSSILSAATTQTAFLDSSLLGDTLKKSDFSLRELRNGKTTIYVCLPAIYMGTHARWLRVIVNMTLVALQQEGLKPPDPPTLIVLEEFNVLGHMAAIATAAGQIAGYGVQLLTVLQDLSQLKANYRDSWETFMGNAGLVLAFANSDVTTLEYISKKLGSRSIEVVTQAGITASAAMAGSTGANVSHQTVALLHPDELEQALARDRNTMLVLLSGARPLIVERSISHDDPRFESIIGLPR